MYRWVCIDGWKDRWMECFGGSVNRMVCGMGWSGVVKLDGIGLDSVGL